MRKTLMILALALTLTSGTAHAQEVSEGVRAIFELPVGMLDHSVEFFRMTCSKLDGEYRASGEVDHFCELSPTFGFAGTWENGFPVKTGLYVVGDLEDLQMAATIATIVYGEPTSVKGNTVRWESHERANIVAQHHGEVGMLMFVFFPKGSRL